MPAEFLCNLPKNLTTHLTHKLYSVFPKARGKRWEFAEYCHDSGKTTQQRRFTHSQFVKNEVPFLVVLPKSRQISCAVFTLSGRYGTIALECVHIKRTHYVHTLW